MTRFSEGVFGGGFGGPESGVVPTTGQLPIIPASGSILLQNVPQPVLAPTVKVSNPCFKAITIPESQVSDLIGPKGCRINEIRRVSGADVRVDHQRGMPYATIVIAGATAELGEKMVYAHLAARKQNFGQVKTAV